METEPRIITEHKRIDIDCLSLDECIELFSGLKEKGYNTVDVNSYVNYDCAHTEICVTRKRLETEQEVLARVAREKQYVENRRKQYEQLKKEFG